MPDKNKSLKTFITPKTDLKPNNIFDDYFKNPIPSTSISKKPITQQQNKTPDISTGTVAGMKTGSNDTTPPEDNTIRSGAIRIVTPDTTPQPTQTDDSDSRFLASLIGQGTAMLGAGIQGRSLSDVAEQFDYMRELDKRREYQKQQDEERKLQQKKAQEQLDELTNPNSAISKSKRLTYGKVFNIDIDPQYTASDLSDPVVLRALQQQSEEQRMARMPKGIGVTQPKVEKEKKNPFQKEITEINIKSKNTIDALDELEKLVSQYGTTEIFGPESNTMQQLIDSIATDYSKIKDPNSTVREGEADRVRASLGLGGISGALTSKSTALKQIQNFRNMVKRQRDTSISQYQNPNAIDINASIDFSKEK